MRLFLFGVIASVLPIYSFISWYYIFYKYEAMNQLDKVEKFENMLFGIFENQVLLAMLNIGLSLVGVILFGKSISKGNKTLKALSVLMLVFLAFICLLNVWSIL